MSCIIFVLYHKMPGSTTGTLIFTRPILVYKLNGTIWCLSSSLRRWSTSLLVGLTDPYNHTYSESLWWKLFKNHKTTQIQRQRQWQRQRQRQRHRQSAWKHNICYIFEILMNMMIDTSAWSSCSSRSTWLACYGHTISSTGLSVSAKNQMFPGCNFLRTKTGLKLCLCFEYG